MLWVVFVPTCDKESHCASLEKLSQEEKCILVNEKIRRRMIANGFSQGKLKENRGLSLECLGFFLEAKG